MSLTEMKIKQAKPRAKRYTISDTRNLLLEVYPNGSKFWILRIFLNNKEFRRHLGKYPEVSLKLARVIAASEHLTEINSEPENLFGEIAEEWFTRHMNDKKLNYIKSVRLRLNNYILPKFKDISINEITAGMILKFCQAIENTGKIETASRVKNIISQIFSYAVATDRVENNPCFNLRGALMSHSQKHMAAITVPSEIARLMRDIEKYPNVLIRFALKFSAMTFCRPGEIRHAEWKEIDFENCEWRIPAEKMKMKRTHIVPLSRQVIEILKNVKKLKLNDKWIFPQLKKNKPMQENAVREALRAMGYGNDEMTAHGFRAMASTRLHELGWQSEIIERQLAHSDKNSVRSAYNHAEYLDERKKLMQFWADYLEKLAKC